MRLAWKQTLALLACIVVVVGAHAWSRFTGVADALSADMRRDHHSLGRGLAPAVAAVWRDGGEERALALLEQADEREGQLRVRWTEPSAAPGSARRPAAPAAALASLRLGQDAHWVDDDGAGRQYTYVAVAVPGRLGALELSESLEPQRAFSRGTLGRILLTALVLAGASSAAVLGVGWWFVGRPVRRLGGFAGAVGAGDFSQRIELDQRDELGDLARELSRMSERLQEARGRVAAAAEARAVAESQLRHADRLALLGTLAAGIAHELGTPLNVVGSTARMIRTGEIGGADVAAEAGVIEQQAERMTGIVRQVLDFARPRPPRAQRTDLVALVRGTLRLLHTFARQRGVGLRFDAPDGGVATDADGAQLQQVLSNLVVNAAQAMVDGGEVRVSAGIDPARREAWIEVRDAGPGIPRELWPRLFEPFFTTKEAGEGSGLGLSVAWGIVHEHGGRIEVGDAPGGGASITVWLPATPGEDP